METAEVTTNLEANASVTNASGVGKTYTETRVRLAEYSRSAQANEDGSLGRKTETSIFPEAKANKRIEEAKKLHSEGKLDEDLIPEILVSQTCLFTEAKVIDELLTLCSAPGKEDQAEQVALGHFNRGAILSQQQEVRKLMEDANFTPVEGILDLTYAIAEQSERRGKSPEEKAAKILAGMDAFKGQSPDEIMALLAEFAASRSAQVAG